MPLFCTTTGLKVVANPEWISQKVSETFTSNFTLIAGSIIYSRPEGYADLNGVQKSLKILDRIIDIASEGKAPYIQIEDFSLLKGSSIEARKCEAEKKNEDPRRKSVIYCNVSLPLSIAIKLYSQFISSKLDIQVVKSYKDAIEIALKSLQNERKDLDTPTLDICNSYKTVKNSLSTVEILVEDFLNIQSQGYSCPSFIIDKYILHSENIGYFQEEHTPLIGQMIADCHKTFNKVSIQYNVIDCKDFKGIHPKARIKHMNAMKKWFQQYPLKMIIMYNVSTSMKAALYIANAVMPFEIRVAQNIQHAFQIINDNERGPEITVVKKSQMPLSITQNDIEELITLIGNLHWDGDVENEVDVHDVIDINHPFYTIYKSINLINDEIDDLIKERKRSEEKFRFLAENMGDIVWTLDMNFNATYVSPSVEKVLGYTVEERKQQKIEDMVTPEAFDLIMAKFVEVMESDNKPGVNPDRPLNVDIEYLHKNGSVVWMENVIKAIRDESNEIVGMYGVSRDITERKTSEREKEKLINGLKQALDEVKTLSGLVPICSSCKKIRDDQGYWNVLESYIQKHSKAQFSHSLCPECSDKFYGDDDWYIEMKKKKKDQQ